MELNVLLVLEVMMMGIKFFLKKTGIKNKRMFSLKILPGSNKVWQTPRNEGVIGSGHGHMGSPKELG